MTFKSSSFKKAAMAVIMVTSSVAFAQNAPPSGSFIPADGVVGVGGGSAVSSGVGAGMSTGVIVGTIVAVVAIAAVGSNNNSSGTTGTR